MRAGTANAGLSGTGTTATRSTTSTPSTLEPSLKCVIYERHVACWFFNRFSWVTAASSVLLSHAPDALPAH